MVVQETRRPMADEQAIALINGVPKLQRMGTDEPPREWLFTGADELFRGLHTRAGIGFASEVLMVSSALAGEGKTTLSLGLALTLPQAYPDRPAILSNTHTQP